MNTALYVAHSVHNGSDIDYEYSKDLGANFQTLPYLYAITLIERENEKQLVKATILVKTDLEQTKDNVKEIYDTIVQITPALMNLPTSKIALRCTECNIEFSGLPNEQELLKILVDVFTINATGGTA